MALAKNDIQARKIEVKRVQLVETLKTNKAKHVAEYQEAKAGYKSALLSKLDASVADARKLLEKSYEKRKAEIAEMAEDEIGKQTDYVRLVDPIGFEMKVPRSFEKEYDAALDVFAWDVRETVELTYAEFTCFVRDEWDWKSDFVATSTLYNKAPAAAR